MPTLILFWPWRPDARAPAAEATVLEGGFAAAVNAIVEQHPHADIAVLADACTLPDGWPERLRAAAHADDTAAAASALVTGDGGPMFSGSASDPVIVDAPPIITGHPQHPRLLVLRPQCTLIRASALELVGPLDASLAHPAAVLADFSARALSRGLTCVLADDVIVVRGEGGLGPCPEPETRAVAERHPWLDAVREEEDALELGPLRGALVAARAAARPLSVTIDARSLGPATAGTQVYASGLVLALAGSGRVTIRAVVRDDASGPAIDALASAGVELIGERRAQTGLPRTDIAHRPQQVFVVEDLGLLHATGERIVITHLDLIAYRNPAYHDLSDHWRGYRRITRLALSAADRVVFLSEHTLRDALAEQLIDPGYAAVVGAAIDPTDPDRPARRPERVPAGTELLAMIGADYLHKNRLFALELVGELRRRHGWDGILALAGAHVTHGGSAAAEAALLDRDPGLAEHVLDLGPVDDDEKHWLLGAARAVLCPSTYEGFGLTPLEAAAAGTACVYAATTSLTEVVGDEAATIVPWDAAASADRVIALLRDGEARERHLTALRGALPRYRWDAIADRLCDVYVDAVRAPYRTSMPRAWEELLREQRVADLDRRYDDLAERVDHGLPLIDRGGLLTREQQRGLMRIASRRWLNAPLLGPVGWIGSVRDDDQGPSSP